VIGENLFYKISGIDKSGWKYEDYENFIKNDNNNINFYTQCRNLVNKIKQTKNSWPFLKPVDPKEVPDYYEVIKEPMGKKTFNFYNTDLSTLENNLESGIYKTKEKFVKDLKKIFSNAKSYNKPYTIYHKYAKDLENSIEDSINSLKDN
jgi:histone acetyltransferase